MLAPPLVDQAVGRDDLIGIEDADREQRAHLSAGQLNRLTVGDDRQRSENPKVHDYGRQLGE